jgi:DNA-binding Lrp family transcriptional regulator
MNFSGVDYMGSLDKIDNIILQALLEDGRASFSAIARESNLTDVAIKKRVESLKRRGVIDNISVDLNYKVLGYENPIFLQIRSSAPKQKDVIKRLCDMDFVLELHKVMGEYDLMVKIIAPNLETGDKFISQIGLIDGVMEHKTMVVTSQIKQSKTLPSLPLQKKI